MKLKNPVNIILLAISFLILSAFGIIFITQMELVPGYNWTEISNLHPIKLEIQPTGDLNEDGIPDIIASSYIRDIDLEDIDNFIYNFPRYGGIYAIDGTTGKTIWSKEYDTPVRGLFPIGDINTDGYDDFFASMVRVNESWEIDPYETDRFRPGVVHNNFTNILISGKDGSSLSGNITTNLVLDVIRISELGDYFEDFILLEGKYFALPSDNYHVNMSTYFINGTRTKSIFMNSTSDAYVFHDKTFPTIREFDYNGQNHALFLKGDAIILYNTSVYNLLDPIFSKKELDMNRFNFIEDINLDGILEIFAVSWEGNVSILNGLDGNLLDKFKLPINSSGFITAMNTPIDDGIAHVLFTTQHYNEREFFAYVYSISLTEQNIIWEYYKYVENEDEELPECFVIEEDLTGDQNDEILLTYSHTTLTGQENTRLNIIDPVSNTELAIVNADHRASNLITIPDFDGDGKKDYAFEDGDSIYAIATQKPLAIWLSPLFEAGFPILIILASMLVFGVVVVIINGKKLKLKRNRLQQSKLAVVVNVVVIALMTISFLMFLLLLNIFNRTLIMGDPMSSLTIVYTTTTIIWFGMLPLTAAIYNQFAPQFAYGFIMLRTFFFKFSKSYKHAIIVEDLQNRKQLSTTVRLKRVILPLFLSIAVGFYSYNTFSTMLGFPQEFDVFGGTQFLQFMVGYNLLSIIPMILTYLVFSFFISGNYLLDDAGIAYYLESIKHRKPSDIEPISIWAQSIIKGVAGFSAIITFIAFFQTVDFSGFFTGTDTNALFMFIFGIFLLTVMFYGTPFLTSLAYMLFSIEVMDYSYDYNSEKLYRIMQKHGYDTTPRKFSNLFPSGFEDLRRKPESKKEKKKSD